MPAVKFKTVDEYINSYPDEVQNILGTMRQIIKSAAPDAEEVISYNMPAYKQHGVLVWFAANKNHLGFYPSSDPVIVFSKDLSKYKTSKGAIQFPLSEKIPKTLVRKIVKYRLKQNTDKLKLKK